LRLVLRRGRQRSGHHCGEQQCGEFEIPASFAASPSQEFQIHKPHWNHKVASAPDVSEVRKRGCGEVMRTSETEHWCGWAHD
jgi:hypothetical protein